MSRNLLSIQIWITIIGQLMNQTEFSMFYPWLAVEKISQDLLPALINILSSIIKLMNAQHAQLAYITIMIAIHVLNVFLISRLTLILMSAKLNLVKGCIKQAWIVQIYFMEDCQRHNIKIIMTIIKLHIQRYRIVQVQLLTMMDINV